MTAGDITVGYSDSIETLDADLVAASVTLAGKPGEIHIIDNDGSSIRWVYINQA